LYQNRLSSSTRAEAEHRESCESNDVILGERGNQYQSALKNSRRTTRTMESCNITDFKVVPCVDSKYIVPTRVSFKQNGVVRKWDYIRSHDSVATLIFNTTRQSFVLVKQFRPALYMNMNSRANNDDKSTVTGTSSSSDLKCTAPFTSGVSYELCAGIVDQQQPEAQIACNEILEETGYEVAVEDITLLFTHHGIGAVGQRMSIYYAEVTDDMRTSEGGGLQEVGEFIEVFDLPLAEAKDFVFDDQYSKPSGLVAAFLWFFMKKGVKYE